MRGVGLAFVCCALLLAVSCGFKEGRGAAVSPRPNIVWVMTDDQDFRSIGRMPAVNRLLVSEGTTFTNSFATTPLCCPSRSTFLTGEYTHSHGIKSNVTPLGAYPKVEELGLEKNTVATWLDDAGYATAYAGKYLNEYFGPHVPAGWDRWYGYTKGIGNPNRYYVNENGAEREIARNELSDPDYLAEKAEQFVGSRPASGAPFFLVLAPSTPHSPYFHAERHANLFSTTVAPRPPNFNEADISDKPKLLREKFPARLDAAQVKALDEKYRDRLRGLRGVDEMVDRVVRALARKGQLENTYIAFTSDNGYALGEHRIEGKFYPHEESIRVPLVVRGPSIPAGARRGEMVANVDWAPTVADWAGVPTPDTVEGRSLDPLFSGSPAMWRKRLLLETFDYEGYSGIRTDDGKLYAEYGMGDGEFYDLSKDPYQLDNAHPTMDPALQADLSAKLAALKDCSGEACRAAEAAP